MSFFLMAKNELELIPEGELQICQFSDKQVRKILHNNEWFFSIVDVIEAMTGSSDPSRYWSELKSKLSKDEGFNQLFGRIEQLKMQSSDGKQYLTDTANTEVIFRIIQSIPSQKAEPLKRWLAKVGYERIQEAQNPSIAIKRAIVDYQMQGRSTEWIDARLRTLISRKELTDEWRRGGVMNGMDYAILTDEISKGTFEKTTKEHKEFKGLKKNHSLRDNMTSIELILTMLGETATKEIARSRNALGLKENLVVARAGGEVAGAARKRLEQQTNASVVSRENNLKSLPPSQDLLKFPESLDVAVKRIGSKKTS
jgi:prophage antirepressor-like protein